MKARTFTLFSSLAIGIAVTLALTAAASLTYDVGAEFTTRLLSWPNTLLQSMIAPHNIGTTEKPVYEGTPLNLLAYFASFPLSICIYTLVAYLLISLRKSKPRNGNGSSGSADKH